MMRKTRKTDITPKTAESGPASSLRTWSTSEWFDEMDRWFDDLRRNFFGTAGLAPFTRGGVEAFPAIRQPLVDLLDQGREFVVRAELPGVSKEDVDLDVTPEGIEIRAQTDREREEKEKDYYYRERRYEALHRILPFPAEVLPDQAQASLKDGLLEVRIPKKEPTPEKKAVRVRVE